MTSEAMLLTHDCATGRAVDISRGGLRLQLDASGPHLIAGERLSVQLELEGAPSGGLRLDGRVQRASRAGEIAIVFTVVPTELAPLVDAAVAAAPARPR